MEIYQSKYTGEQIDEALDSVQNKQDELISGENIKTINNESILGSGNIQVSGGPNIFTIPLDYEVFNWQGREPQYLNVSSLCTELISFVGTNINDTDKLLNTKIILSWNQNRIILPPVIHYPNSNMRWEIWFDTLDGGDDFVLGKIDLSVSASGANLYKSTYTGLTYVPEEEGS